MSATYERIALISILSFVQIEIEYTFLDFILGGCQINFTVSVFIVLYLSQQLSLYIFPTK